LGSPRIWIGIGAVSLLFLCFFKPVPPPSAWAAIETNLAPGRRFAGADELIASDTVQRILSDSRAAVTVLPETVISRWTEATEAFWEPTLAQLHRQHRLAVIGAGVAIPDSPAYRNAVLIIGGEQPQAFFQRVPVPVGMWRPFGNGPSVPLRLDGAGTIEVADQRVAFVICYEQLLVLPVLLAASERPTLIVGMANQYWVRETSIPAAQRASLTAWSRLFALPLLIAENR
jgi:predicted amidohydrolase